MKRFSLLIITLFATLISFAQEINIGADHYLLVWAGGNANMTFDKLDWTQGKIGEGGMIGIGYQWKEKYFIVNTGLELAFQHRVLSIADANLSQAMLDTEGMPFTYNGHLKDRTDMMNEANINLPLLIGAKGNLGYFLAGLKIGINGYTFTKQRGYYSTEGLYDRFYDPLVNMPNHGFHDYEQTITRNALWIGLNLKASVELGIVIPTKKENLKVRVGLFGDYGFYEYNIRDSHIVGDLLTSSWNQYLQLTLNHAYLSTMGANEVINNLEAGLKVTFQWKYKHRFPCVICHWSHWK